MPNTYQKLEEIGALHRNYLDEFFIHFFYHILPIDDIIYMLDCYLVEGIKILVRYAIAIFAMYKTDIKNNEFKTGEEFWLYLKNHKDDDNLYGLSLRKLVYDDSRSISNFFRVLHVSREVWDELIRKADLSKKRSDEEDLSQPYNADEYLPPLIEPSDHGSRTVSDSIINLKKKLTSQQLVSLGPFATKLMQASKILTPQTVTNLAPMIPEMIQYEGLRLLYNSNIHGISLDTLYTLTDTITPCLIIIKCFPIEEYSTTPIIGFFCTESITPPSYSIGKTMYDKSDKLDLKGSSHCFCFRLDGENAVFYNAVQPEEMQEMIELQKNNEKKINLSTLTQYFTSNATDGIIIGGSAVHHTNALKIDTELNYCYCGPSDTYKNDNSLLPELCDHINVSAACKIAEIEVLGGNYSIDNALKRGKLKIDKDGHLLSTLNDNKFNNLKKKLTKEDLVRS